MQTKVPARNIILIVGIFFAVHPNVLSQTKDPLPEVNGKMLSAFRLLSEKAFGTPGGSCQIDPNLSTEETLNEALRYNKNGNWKYCTALLSSLLNKINKLSLIDKLHLQLAQAEYLNSHQLYDSARLLANNVNHEAAKKGLFNEQAEALLLLSVGALKRRSMSSAYLWADSAIQISRKSHVKITEGKALLQMAFCARRHFTSSSHRAFPYYLQAIDVSETVADSVTLFGGNLYYAVDHFEIGQWEEGLPYFNRAMEIALKSTNVYEIYSAFIGTGYTLTQKGFMPQAILLFKRALALSQQQRLPYNVQHSYFEIADAFQASKQYDSALIYANLASNVPGIDSFWSNMWLMKAKIFKNMGNFKMATDMYAKAMDWANEDFLYRNQDQLSSYEAKLKTAEKELQVVQEKKRSIQLEWLIGAVALLLLMAALAFFLQTRARRKLVIQNAIIKKQQFELEKSLSEKDMLLKEIHHRVKNNLSVISSLLELQASNINDEKAKAAIAEGQNRVSSIALVHQRLYQHGNLAAIDFEGFVKDMIPQVSSILKRPGQVINTNIQIPETLLDIDTAVPLGLVVNELLTNSFKYAFTNNKEGLIGIKLATPQPGNYVLTYLDNGPGMPLGFDLKKSKSLGLRLIDRLSSQIGGNAAYTYSNGCMFVVNFKNAITRNKEA